MTEHLGASSRCPRHPVPRPDGGGTPGRVPVYTAQKRQAKLKLPCAPVEPVKQHNRDVDDHMYGTRRNLCGLQRARPWEPALCAATGMSTTLKSTYRKELHTCTTGTKTALSNCNCEISMAGAMGISHCAKTGVSTTVKTASAELRAPVVDQQRA